MRHQTGDAAVPIQKGMEPDQTMMSGGGGKDGFRFPEPAVDLFESMQESRHRTGADGNVAAYLDVAMAKFSWNYSHALFSFGIFDPQKIIRQQFAEAAVDFQDALDGSKLVRRHRPGRSIPVQSRAP